MSGGREGGREGGRGGRRDRRQGRESKSSSKSPSRQPAHYIYSSLLPSFPPSLPRHALLPFSSELDGMMEAERHIPLWKPVALTICFLGIVVTDVLKVGREGGREGGKGGRGENLTAADFSPPITSKPSLSVFCSFSLPSTHPSPPESDHHTPPSIPPSFPPSLPRVGKSRPPPSASPVAPFLTGWSLWRPCLGWEPASTRSVSIF